MLNTETEELYTVYDHNNGQFFDFYDLDDMFHTMNSHCRRNYGSDFVSLARPSFNFEIVDTRHNLVDLLFPSKVKSLYVVDFYGNFVDLSTYRPYRYRTKNNPHYNFIEARNDLIESNLVIKNHNVDKIKPTHARKLKYSAWAQEFRYARVVRGHYRHIHTLSNHRKVVAVLKDEGEPVFRGKQRNLPTYWDDLPLGIWKNYKSWKHNSKRKKQWKMN